MTAVKHRLFIGSVYGYGATHYEDAALVDSKRSELLRARALTLAALGRLVGRGQLSGRVNSAYRDKLCKINIDPDFPTTAIDILAEFDETLGNDNEAQIGELAAEHLAQNVAILLREFDAVLLRQP